MSIMNDGKGARSSLHGHDGRPSAPVTLTRPPVVVPKWGIFSGLICPPIGIAYIASSLRGEGHRVTIIDPVGESPFEVNPVDGRPLVSYGWSLEKIVSSIPDESRYIGVACMFSHEWPMAKLLIKRIRERFPDACIVTGGEHMTSSPEFSLRDCAAIDYAVLGEGEETFTELINALESGRGPEGVAGIAYMGDDGPVRTAPRMRIRDVEDIPWPAWDLIPMENYLSNGLSYGVSQGRTMPIMATRGCPFQCTFCSSPNMWTQRWYARSPKDVADEIETYARKYGAENFDFYDLTAILRKEWIIDFCNELIRRDLRITWQLPAGTRSEAIDSDVAPLLARSGHRNLVYAPESGSERILDAIKKKTRLDRMISSMRSSIRSGISVKLNMIFGFPQETRQDIIESYKFLAKVAWVGVDDVTISTFIPYPGSELFNELRKSGKIGELDEDYFYGLVAMGDAHCTPSFSEKISGKALLRYKLLGVLLFYSLSYLLRPQRFAQTLWHLYRGNHRTRIEKALSSLISRVRIYSRA